MQRLGDGMRGIALVRDRAAEGLRGGEVDRADGRQDLHPDVAAEVQLVRATEDDGNDRRAGAQPEVADARGDGPRLAGRDGRSTFREDGQDGAALDDLAHRRDVRVEGVRTAARPDGHHATEASERPPTKG